MMDNQGFEEIKKKLRLTNQGISDVMGVRLCTVQCWADGVWEMPLMAEKFLRTLLSMERDNEAIYMTGYHKGVVTGHEAGHRAGLQAGREKNVQDLRGDILKSAAEAIMGVIR